MSETRTYHIFISSTFKDMDAERDLIINAMKPQLIQRLQEQNIMARVEIIDLRWGVNTQDIDEEERENKVLGECLNGIRESKPFFIGFIGDRYGWIPSRERWRNVVEGMSPAEREMMGGGVDDVRSVTELEILFGVLHDKDCMPNSFFFMRRPESYANMPADKKATYCDHDPEAQRKLQALKDKLLTAYHDLGLMGNITNYEGRWDGSKMVLDEGLFNDVIDKIVKSVMFMADQDEAAITTIDSLIDNDKKLLEERNAYFAGRERELQEMMRHIETGKVPLVTQAADGMGKTSLLAQLYERLRADDRYLPLIHFGERLGPQAAVENMLKKWLWQMEEAVKLRRPMQMEAHPGMLFYWLRAAMCNCKKRPVLLIDNIHLLKFIKAIVGFEDVGDSYAVVVTTDRPIAHLVDGKNAHYLTLGSMPPNDAKLMIGRYMGKCHKSLPSEVVTTILGKVTEEGHPAVGMPLWTTLLLSQLANLETSDYAKLRNQDVADEAEKITRYLCDKVNEASAHVMDYFADVLENTVHGNNGELTREMLNLVVGKGLSYELLCETLRRQVDRMDYVNFMHAMESMTRCADNSGLFQINYPTLFGIDLPDTIDEQPMEAAEWTNFTFHTSENLLRLYHLFRQKGLDDMAQAFYDEAMQNLSCINDDIVAQMLKDTETAEKEWEGFLEHIMHDNLHHAYDVCQQYWKEQPSWTTKLMLQLAYLLNCSMMEMAVRASLSKEPDAIPMGKLLPSLEHLNSMYVTMNQLHPRNLMSYLADYYFCSTMENVARNVRGNANEARHHAAQKEKAAMTLYAVGPTSRNAMRQYANALDENARLIPSRAAGKLDKALEIYGKILNEDFTEEAMQDFLGTAAQIIQVLNLSKEPELAREKYESMREIAANFPQFDINRVMGIASDYACNTYFLLGQMGKAHEAVMAARAYFLKDLEVHPNSLVTIHSLAEIAKRKIDLKMKGQVMSANDIDELEHWARLPLGTLPNDFKSHCMLMESLLYRMCLNAYTQDATKVPQMAQDAFRQIMVAMTNGMSYKMLNLHHIMNAASGLASNGHLAELEELLRLITELRNTLTNARLVPIDFFDKAVNSISEYIGKAQGDTPNDE